MPRLGVAGVIKCNMPPAMPLHGCAARALSFMRRLVAVPALARAHPRPPCPRGPFPDVSVRIGGIKGREHHEGGYATRQAHHSARPKSFVQQRGVNFNARLALLASSTLSLPSRPCAIFAASAGP